MNRATTAGLSILGWLLLAGAPKPPPAIDITRADARVEFPEGITFSIKARSDSRIETLELEFGLAERSCTPDVNLVVPDAFSPAADISINYTWDVGSEGNLPPGMRLWWDWRLVDAAGNEVRSDRKWITWLDSIHDWKTLTSENILLHWYNGTEAYNRKFLNTAETAREKIRSDLGTWPAREINIYIYASNEEMKDALVGEPDWIGGLSFSENQRTIIIGIDRGNEAWGMRTIAHELTHTAIDGFMGGCFGTVPLWLNEGAAMYMEGDLEKPYAAALDDAIYYNSLFSLRSISYMYQSVDGDPTLTYAESYSVVAYLIQTQGNKKIQKMITRLGEGYTYDNALMDALGVDTDGLEAEWRKAIGADPMRAATPQSGEAESEATLLPPSMPEELSTATPEFPTPTKSADVRTGTGGAGEALVLVFICGLSVICLAVSGAVVLILVFRRRGSTQGAGEGRP
jgi:hypothetical protein